MGNPPEVKGHTPKEIIQKIKSENQWEVDLDLDPKAVPWMYIGNIIQRTLSRMIGQGPYGPVTVKCTKEGNLAMVQRGGAFDDYERLEFAFTSANEVKEFTFSQQVERIDIFTYDGKCDYQLTRDLIKAYGDKIELFTDSFYSLDFYTHRVRCTCKSFSPKSSGTETSHTADKLVDAGADFVTDAVKVGDVVANITKNLYATVTNRDNLTTLSLSENIFTEVGAPWDKYSIEGTRVKLMGWFREGG
jgi:hypothetical protein